MQLVARSILAAAAMAAMTVTASAQDAPDNPVPATSADEACHDHWAGEGFVFETGTQRLPNDGIRVRGFVDVRGASVQHGVDLSKYQEDVDLVAAHECGARFAFVRVSAGSREENEPVYRTNWASVRAAGLVPGPYHSLTVPPHDQAVALIHNPDALQPAIIAARASGAAQAQLFLKHVDELAGLDVHPADLDSTARSPTLPLAVAVTADPLADEGPETKSSFAPVYQAAACAFLEAVKADPRAAGRMTIMFVSQGLYESYHLASAVCGLDAIPLWLRHRPRDGSPPSPIGRAADAAAICTDPAGRPRCLFDQYTSNGVFAKFGEGSAIDLDRFLGSERELEALIASQGR